MQFKFSPIALFIKTAATVESTPPDKPKITLSDFILLVIFETVSLIKILIQFCLNFKILIKKL